MDTREALAQLVALKDHKDKFGKDAQYEAAKDKAWDDARAALKQPPMKQGEIMVGNRVCSDLVHREKQPPMSEDEAVEIIGNECFGLLAMSSNVRPFIVSKSKNAYRALLARWGQ